MGNSLFNALKQDYSEIKNGIDKTPDPVLHDRVIKANRLIFDSGALYEGSHILGIRQGQGIFKNQTLDIQWNVGKRQAEWKRFVHVW